MKTFCEARALCLLALSERGTDDDGNLTPEHLQLMKQIEQMDEKSVNLTDKMAKQFEEAQMVEDFQKEKIKAEEEHKTGPVKITNKLDFNEHDEQFNSHQIDKVKEGIADDFELETPPTNKKYEMVGNQQNEYIGGSEDAELFKGLDETNPNPHNQSMTMQEDVDNLSEKIREVQSIALSQSQQARGSDQLVIVEGSLKKEDFLAAMEQVQRDSEVFAIQPNESQGRYNSEFSSYKESIDQRPDYA